MKLKYNFLAVYALSTALYSSDLDGGKPYAPISSPVVQMDPHMITWEDVDHLQTAAMTGDASVKAKAAEVLTTKMNSVFSMAARDPNMITWEDVDHLQTAAMTGFPGAQDLLNKLASMPAK